jgi:small-conductance mechanosensitive channel
MSLSHACRVVLALAFAALAAAAAAAVPEAAVAEAAPPEATLTVANRDIVVFRTTLLGIAPALRASRARDRIEALTQSELEDPVKAFPATLGDIDGISILVGDRVAFSLLRGDVDPEGGLTLAKAAEQARARLEDALRAKRDQRRLPVLLKGLVHAAAVTALLVLLMWLLNRAGRTLVAWLERRRDAHAARTGSVQWREYVVRFLTRLLLLGRWALVVVLLYGWLAYVLDHFPLTEPFGRQLAHFVASLAGWLVEGVIAAVPGIVTVALILFITRALIDVIAQFFEGVQTGHTQMPFLHPETVSATRRIVTFIAWTLALVVAYPFIPGSGSDAFKGLSVLFGVMLSLGSTGLVTQMMSGLVIVYSRALHKGDFVAVNGIEGVVTEVGTLATKVVTMRGEEITIPNTVLIGSPIHNYSKLAGARGTMVSTKVTIGYDAPWRQVHALLELAAARTAGVRTEPKAFVYQRALSDFYAEYELFAYVDQPLQRIATLSALHANIQDAFNEHGVQIMSPHFVLQPDQAVVVPPEAWYAEPARQPGSPESPAR